MTDPIIVDVTEDDLPHLLRWMLRNNRELRRNSLGFAIASPILIILFGVFLDWPPVPLGVFAVTVPVIYLFIFRWMTRSSLAKHARDTPGVLGRHTFVMEEAGLRETTDANDSLNAWSAITGVSRDAHAIWLSLGPNSIHMIPHRAFESSSASNAFEEELRNRIKSANPGF